MRLRLLVPLLVLLVVPAHTAFGYLAGKVGLDDVLDRATVAVAGQIVSVGEGTPVERRQVGLYSEFASPVHFRLRPAIVRVEAVLEGDGIAPGAAVPFSFLWYDAGKPNWIMLPEYKPGQRWMLFLGTIQGHLEPVNPLGFQDLQLPDDYRPKQPNYRLPLQRTEAVLAEVLLRPQQLAIPSHGLGKTRVEEILLTLGPGSLTVVVPRGAGDPFYGSVTYRPAFTTAVLVNALASLSRASPDPSTRAMAAGILVRAGSIDAIRTLISAARELARHGGGEGYGAVRAVRAIEDVQDRACLPLLHRLLFDPVAAFHAPAAQALRTIADPSSIPYLVKALDDPSFDVRYFAATGLAAITKERAHYLAVDSFRVQEAQQIAYWKSRYRTPEGR